jgi:2-keto-4-pentenoate hydratase
MQQDTFTARERALAQRLTRARADRIAITDLPAKLVPDDRDSAYRVAELVRQGLGWQGGGWKIAGTNPTMQQRLRAHEPIYGRVFAQFIHESPAVIECEPLMMPIIECEFAFELGRDLPARESPYTADEVAAAVSAVRPAIEVAECRFPDEHLPAIEGVLADHSGSGHLVLGERLTSWTSADLTEGPVRLLVDGEERRSGSGALVLGNPLLALVWLVNQRRAWPQSIGGHLLAGEVVSTGTCTGMRRAHGGETFVGDFGPLGTVAVRTP